MRVFRFPGGDRPRRGGRRSRVRFSVCAAALTLAVAGAGLGALTGTAGPAAASGTGCASPVAQPVGPFSIASNHRTVLDSKGRPFISYGTTVPGLAQANFSPQDPQPYVQSVVDGKDIPKIDATADVWCGNTVRLQVSQYDVTPDGSTCDTTFLTDALDAEVHAGEAKGLAVVVNDTTESDPQDNSERDPTTATFTFWNCVSQHTESWPGGVEYGQDPQVIFDIFNEPRADGCSSANGPYDMNLWRNGGTYTGCGQTDIKYQGMDAVVYHIREDGATNLLWAEGPGAARTLAGLTPAGGPSYLLTDKLNKVVYAIHHPVVGPGDPAGSATWWKEFGYLVDLPAATGTAPVVSGEWTNESATANGTNYCWSDAPTSVPAYLSYLQKLGVGMSAYQLADDSLLTANPPAWTETTNYTAAPWNSAYCTSYKSGQPLLGAGADILAWFQRQD